MIPIPLTLVPVASTQRVPFLIFLENSGFGLFGDILFVPFSHGKAANEFASTGAARQYIFLVDRSMYCSKHPNYHHPTNGGFASFNDESYRWSPISIPSMITLVRCSEYESAGQTRRHAAKNGTIN